MTNTITTTNKITIETRQYMEYESEKAALMPELIRFFNGDTDTAEVVAEEMAWGLIYA